MKYAQPSAPYDGVVTKRYVNTGDFVQPAGSGVTKEPLYVVQQIDPVRVFINVPGSDAAWVKDNDVVMLRLQGSGGELFPGKVTRTSHSLNPQTRTLRTEIDLANAKGKLLPGMYVQASITIQQPADAADLGRRCRWRHLLLPVDDKASARRCGSVYAAAGWSRSRSDARQGASRRRGGRSDKMQMVGGDAVLADGQPIKRKEGK